MKSKRQWPAVWYVSCNLNLYPESIRPNGCYFQSTNNLRYRTSCCLSSNKTPHMDHGDYPSVILSRKWVIRGLIQSSANAMPSLELRAALLMGHRGPLMGVPKVTCRFYEMAVSHVSLAYFPQCHMSNLSKGYVTCHYICNPHVASLDVTCRILKIPMSPYRF